MKFSMCTTGMKDKKIEYVIDEASKLGLDGIEIWDGHIDEYLDRFPMGIQSLKKHLEDKNIKCVTILPYFDFIDQEKVNESLKCVQKCLEYAKALDCNMIRTFIGYKPSSQTSEFEWSNCINILKKVVKSAEIYKVVMILETHFNQPMDRAEIIKSVIKEVDNPHLKILFDGFNFFVDGIDMMQQFLLLKSHSIHYHIKNYFWKSKEPTDLAKGDVDFKPLIKELLQTNYSGYLSFEYFCDNPNDIIKSSIEWIHLLSDQHRG